MTKRVFLTFAVVGLIWTSLQACTPEASLLVAEEPGSSPLQTRVSFVSTDIQRTMPSKAFAALSTRGAFSRLVEKSHQVNANQQPWQPNSTRTVIKNKPSTFEGVWKGRMRWENGKEIPVELRLRKITKFSALQWIRSVQWMRTAHACGPYTPPVEVPMSGELTSSETALSKVSLQGAFSVYAMLAADDMVYLNLQSGSGGTSQQSLYGSVEQGVLQAVLYSAKQSISLTLSYVSPLQ